MPTIKLYLDTRANKGEPNKQSPLKIAIRKNNRTALISLKVFITPDQWDKSKCIIINHPNKSSLNNFLKNRYIQIENELMSLKLSGECRNLTAQEIKDAIVRRINNIDEEEKPTTFVESYKSSTENKTNKRTKEIYETTLKRMYEYDKYLDERTFEDISNEWLTSFNKFLSIKSPSVNARNIHFRNIRSVFNDAIDDNITSSYPFRKFKLKNELTINRSLSTDALRELFSLNVRKVHKEYIDIFKLIFFLCGINIVDLLNLKKSNINNGRIEYIRAKTKKFYSIKIEPEASNIIEQYKGSVYLLNILDRYKNYKDYLQHLNAALKKVGIITGKTKNGVPIMKPICEELSTYWARHSWATTASELDIPKETISAGLGHNIGSPITSIYIDFNIKKVDEANRKIIDYILYNKV